MLLRISVIVLLFYSSVFSIEYTKNKQIDIYKYGSLPFIEKKPKTLLDIIDIKRVVKLESNNECIIGHVNTIFCNKEGDFYIGDYYKAKKIFKFDKNGKYLSKYGKEGEGPAEQKRLIASIVLTSGELIILSSDRIQKFSPDNKLIIEKKIKFIHSGDLCISNNEIFLILNGIDIESSGFKIIRLDKNLNVKDGIGKYDTFLNKYGYLPDHYFATNGKDLCLNDYFNQVIWIYPYQNQSIKKIVYPMDKRVYEIGQSNKMSNALLKYVYENFYVNYGTQFYKNYLYGVGIYEKKNIHQHWVIDISKMKILKIPKNKLDSKNSLQLNRIIGSNSEGFIGCFSNAESFNLHKQNYPKLKNIEYEEDDNVVLVIFNFNAFK